MRGDESDISAGPESGGGGPRWRRFPRFPLILVIASLGLVVILPLLTLWRLEELSEQLQEVIRPAIDALGEVRLELAREGSSTRAYLLTGSSEYAEKHYEARRRRAEAVQELRRLAVAIGPEVQSAVALLDEGMVASDRLQDSLFAGDVPPSAYRDFLPPQHRRFLAAMDHASSLDRTLRDRSDLARLRYERIYRLGLLVEYLLVGVALFAVLLVFRLGRSFQALALDLEQVANQQALLREISTALVESVSVRETMEIIARSAVQTSRAFGAFVERSESEERAWVVVVAAEGRGTPPRGTRVAYPGSLTEHMMESGEPQVVAELGEIGSSMAPYLAERCAGCMALVVPLLYQGTAHGALVLLRSPEQPPFSEEEVRHARAIGNLASAALRPALLHEALAESEERFRQVADHLEQVIWLGSPDLGFRYYTNPAYEKVWGRSVESVYEDPGSPYRAIHPDDYEAAMATIRTVGQGPYDARYRVVRPDGSVRWVRSRGYPVRNVRGEVYRVAGITEDVTEAMQAEQEREELLRREREAREEAERRQAEVVEITRSRERFIRGLGHDLKNPLSAADGYLQLLERQAGDLLPTRRQLQLERARRSLHRALDLLENLQEFARVQAGPIDIQVARVDVGAIVEQVVEEARAQAETKGLGLELRLPEGLPPIVSDERRIAQVLGNLLSNAVKYTEAGRITVSARVQGERLGIAVSDTGVGIARADQARIFEEFQRLSTREEGTGIGLAISQLFARALGGTIEVESALGRGATFTLWLPLRA